MTLDVQTRLSSQMIDDWQSVHSWSVVTLIGYDSNGPRNVDAFVSFYVFYIQFSEFELLSETRKFEFRTLRRFLVPWINRRRPFGTSLVDEYQQS